MVTATISSIPEVTIDRDTRVHATKRSDGTVDLRFDAQFQNTPVAVEITLPRNANPPAIIRAGTTVRLSAATLHDAPGTTVVRAKRASTRQQGECAVCRTITTVAASLDSAARTTCMICAQEQAFSRNGR